MAEMKAERVEVYRLQIWEGRERGNSWRPPAVGGSEAQDVSSSPVSSSGLHTADPAGALPIVHCGTRCAAAFTHPANPGTPTPQNSAPICFLFTFHTIGVCSFAHPSLTRACNEHTTEPCTWEGGRQPLSEHSPRRVPSAVSMDEPLVKVFPRWELPALLTTVSPSPADLWAPSRSSKM